MGSLRRAALVLTAAAVSVCILFARPLRQIVLAAEEGYWYLEEFSVEEVHEEGITGKGIKIADIDTLINLNLPWLSDADVVLRDKAITAGIGRF